MGALAVAAATALGVTTAATGASHAAGEAVAPACHTSQLRLWKGLPAAHAAGSTYYEMQVSNISASTCTLFGFPGVSAVNSSGAQLGSPAARDHMFAAKTVTLTPGATAHFVLRLIDVANLPSATCQPVTAAGFRIYPPNTYRSVIVPHRFRACSEEGQRYMYVRVVRPRAGIPNYSQ